MMTWWSVNYFLVCHKVAGEKFRVQMGFMPPCHILVILLSRLLTSDEQLIWPFQQSEILMSFSSAEKQAWPINVNRQNRRDSSLRQKDRITEKVWHLC